MNIEEKIEEYLKNGKIKEKELKPEEETKANDEETDIKTPEIEGVAQKETNKASGFFRRVGKFFGRS